MDTRHVLLSHDADADVWWAESEDIPGLVSEAASFDALVDRVMMVAPEILAENGTRSGRIRIEFRTVRQVEMA